jgi:hypothetical protein
MQNPGKSLVLLKFQTDVPIRGILLPREGNPTGRQPCEMKTLGVYAMKQGCCKKGLVTVISRQAEVLPFRMTMVYSRALH